MERVYAFIDESGAFGWDLENPTVSTTLIISAVLVKESNLGTMMTEVERLRKRIFQTGEIKSSHIGQNHNRRKKS